MAMFPIYLIGVLVGGIVGYAISTLRKNSPSQTRLELLLDEIEGLRNDNAMLKKCIDKKDKAIEQLKEDIRACEERMFK